MDSGVRARSESDSCHENPKSFSNMSVNPVCSDPSLVGLTEKLKHVEFEDALDQQIITASRNGNKLIRNRRARSLYGVSPNCRFGPKGSLLDGSGNFLTIPDPGSQKLNWHKPPLTVLVVKKIYDESILEPFKEVISWLIEVRKMIVFVEASVMEDCKLAQDSVFQQYKAKIQTFSKGKDDLTDKIDFIICLGGDGTLLHASSLFQQSCPPVMAFHQGSLGFLTPFRFENFQVQITQVLEGNASLLLRYRLKCIIMKEDSECGKVPIKHLKPACMSGKQILVLNEVVVDRGYSSFLSNVDLYIEGRYVTSVQGDGLIISTPTGSTAYAVAAGASMIHPNVPAIMITPICPHSLSFRPIVVPAGMEIKIMLSPNSRNSAMVSFDGRDRQEISQGDCVRITTAQYPVPSVCAKDQIDDWFDQLADCLHWNVRKPQKELSFSSTSSSIENSVVDFGEVNDQ